MIKKSLCDLDKADIKTTKFISERSFHGIQRKPTEIKLVTNMI